MSSGQPFSPPAVSPSTSRRSARKKSTTIGTVSTTEPAISTVLGTSIEPDSRDRPSETVHRSGRSSRNSSANRNSFQAIMNTYRPVATTDGAASGRLIRRSTPRWVSPSTSPASSRLSGMVRK